MVSLTLLKARSFAFPENPIFDAVPRVSSVSHPTDCSTTAFPRVIPGTCAFGYSVIVLLAMFDNPLSFPLVSNAVTAKNQVPTGRLLTM